MTYSKSAALHLLFFILLAATAGRAQDLNRAEPTNPNTHLSKLKPADETFRIWPATAPGDQRKLDAEQDFTKPTDKLIAGRRIIKLGNVATPEAHVYFPVEDKRNGSAIVICPGGGFHILAWDLEGTEVAEWLTSIGVTAIVLKYRVPTNKIDPAWLPPAQDAQRTMSLVRQRASKWQLDENKIGILGFSAGAVTAVRTALATKRLYEPLDDVDAISFRPNTAMIIYSGGLINREATALLDDITVSRNATPMFFVHAFDDRVRVESSLLLFLALKRANVPSELHVYDAGGHGYGLRPVAEFPVTTWPARCEEWLTRLKWLERTSD